MDLPKVKMICDDIITVLKSSPTVMICDVLEIVYKKHVEKAEVCFIIV